VADRVICEEDANAIERLRVTVRDFRESSQQISAALDGSAPASLDRDALEKLLSADEGENEPIDWPERLYCERLQKKYTALRDGLAWQKDLLAKQRRTYWRELPPELREILLDLWASRQRLAQSAQALHGMLPEQAFPDIRHALAGQAQALAAQRSAILERMPSLAGEITPDAVAGWLQLWQETLHLAGNLSPPEIAGLKETAPELVGAVNFHHHLLDLDAAYQASRVNLMRGQLWENHAGASRQALDEFPGGRRQVLLNELANMRNNLRWLYLDALAGGPGEADRVTAWRIFRGVEYLLGLLALFGLALLARRSKAPASAMLASLGRNFRRHRGYALFSRVTANLPEFLPLIIGWIGLGLLDSVFRHYGLIQLIPFILLGYIYVLYGLLCLVGEWFVYRIAEQGGSFLNTDRQAQAATGARRFAALVTVPWLLLNLVSVTVGASLSLTMATVLNIVALVIALDLLLLPWRREFIDAVQSFLPAAVDRWVERALAGPGFLVLAPLLSPALLVAILLYSLHKGFVEFDWYRKLMARSFKLRSGAAEDEAAESDEAAMADYQRWFAETIAGDKPPVIKVGTLAVMCDFVSAWQAGSDDNSLLLTGERGSGKTTLYMELMNWLSQQEEPPQLHHADVPAKTTTPDAVAALLQPLLGVNLDTGPAELVRSDEQRQPTVIILENAQNFFLREVGGLAGWEFLLELTRARLRNVLWVVVINNQSWGYLANVFGADYQFSKTLRTRPWTQSEIRSLILSRNQLSGYQIRYDSVLLSTRGPEAGNIRNAEQLYFSLLWDACNGNPLMALGMWLQSITVNGKIVTVSLPPEYSGAALERLGSEMYFVYAALVMHENMTSDELVATTSMTESKVRAALKIAFNMGFVERSQDRRYRIVPLWHAAVARLLSRKNLLHE
jgi:Cdc6-like AAA superfamily ATPase